MLLIDNRSGVQISGAVGSATNYDINVFGGLFKGGFAGLGAYGNTPAGKIIKYFLITTQAKECNVRKLSAQIVYQHGFKPALFENVATQLSLISALRSQYRTSCYSDAYGDNIKT